MAPCFNEAAASIAAEFPKQGQAAAAGLPCFNEAAASIAAELRSSVRTWWGSPGFNEAAASIAAEFIVGEDSVVKLLELQ